MNLLALYLIISLSSFAETADVCRQLFSKIKGPTKSDSIKELCSKVQVLEDCKSTEGTPLFHYDKDSKNPLAQKVFVIGLIHGDETPSAALARFWMERLEAIDPRNSWRILPMANPDGYAKHTRTNANGVDLNRNFPTKDWDEKATVYWKSRAKSDARRYPGKEGASEPETKCLVKHLERYKPDFIISIHTPLKVLDFDGPKLRLPRSHYAGLSWTSLGHFPGSLGRYMWYDQGVPVLTVELAADLPKVEKDLEDLQDFTGTAAIMSLKKKEVTQSK